MTGDMKDKLKNKYTPGAVYATREQMADRYAVSVRQIDQWKADGVLPFMRGGRKLIRFPVERCDEIVARLVVGGAGR